MRQRTIAHGHIALGLIREGQGPAMRVVTDRGLGGRQLAGETGTALPS